MNCLSSDGCVNSKPGRDIALPLRRLNESGNEIGSFQKWIGVREHYAESGSSLLFYMFASPLHYEYEDQHQAEIARYGNDRPFQSIE